MAIAYNQAKKYLLMVIAPMWSLVGAIALSTPLPLVRVSVSVLSSLSRPTLVATTTTPTDPDAQASIQSLLASLAKAGYSRASQGVWLQTSDGILLGSHNGTKLIPSASLTKIATTLAALDKWGSNHQFITKVATNGTIIGNTLRGDLIIQGDGDPLFVWEDAIAIGNALNTMGIYRVEGNLIITKGFYLNFETNPPLIVNDFKQAVNSSRWNQPINLAYKKLRSPAPRPKLVISGKSLFTANYTALTTPLVEHPSAPLWQILKQMNIYSNNDMSEILASSLGGGRVISQKVGIITRLPNEIRLINGSGLGQQNQMSPRAAVAMLIAVQNLAQTQGLSVADLFPAGECRCGTIKERNLPVGAIVKTGTLSDVSALGGVFQTRDRGTVWFAILNRGAGEIDIFHRVQERVLLSLTQKWGRITD